MNRLICLFKGHRWIHGTGFNENFDPQQMPAFACLRCGKVVFYTDKKYIILKFLEPQ